MKISDLPIIKTDERGVIYDCDNVKAILRKKGTISGDHIHEKPDTLFLLEGEIELTIGKTTQPAKAPIKIEIPANTYFKILALTDIKLLENK